MSTFRSRGTDMTAVAFLFGSSRTSIIVSDRAFALSLRSTQRWSEPSTRIVCGLPACTSSRMFFTPRIGVVSRRNASTDCLTSSSSDVATAPAASTTIANAPSRKRRAIAQPACRGGRSASGRALTGRAV
jgi:hypothetical protein